MFLKSVSLFLFYKSVLYIFFKLDATYEWYLKIFVYLTSLSIIISRFNHVAADGIISFLSFYGWVTFHCVCVCVCVYIYRYIYLCICIHTHTYTHHIFFIQFSVSGHLCCLHVLAIVNNASVNFGMHVSFQIMIFFSTFTFNPTLSLLCRLSLEQQQNIKKVLTMCFYISQLDPAEKMSLKFPTWGWYGREEMHFMHW